MVRGLWRAFGERARSDSPWNDEQVLREELFSVERLEKHAVSLAVAQVVTARPVRRRPLVSRLGANEAVLRVAYRELSRAIGEGRSITPAAEWLLDNYHLVESQIAEIRRDLPPGFYRQLPKLADGPLQGYPRVFGIAWAFVAHTDSHVERESLQSFVRAYQTVQPLTIGELWALAITLRTVLVENLRRAAQRIVSNRAARQRADLVADRLLGQNGELPDSDALLRYYSRQPVPPDAFVVQIVQRLRDSDPQVTPTLEWLEARLVRTGLTSEGTVAEEHRRQGASSVTVRNAINSLRAIGELDWPGFFESVSLVDETLRNGSDFAAMDFPSRDRYRRAIEDLARRSPGEELAIAQAVIAVIRRVPRTAGCERDPGHYLFGTGRAAFEQQIGYRPGWRQAPARFLARHQLTPYAAAVFVTSAAVLAVPMVALVAGGAGGIGLAVLGVLGLLPAFDVGVALVNRLVIGSIGPTALPGLELLQGVPAPLRTLVVVPTLLTDPESIDAQIERLGIHALTAPEGEVYFGLLTDWTDAPSDRVAGDEALLACAVRGIADLNERHPGGAAGPRFLLLHRHRVWSETQRCWLGWERKRGKLHELNRLLRGARDTTFAGVGGEPPRVPGAVRYVITLDADTRMPREAIRRLIGKLAHPLNHACFDAATGRVTAGYVVLQPRVTPSLPIGREGSTFQRLISSAAGLDPYAAAVSDVYQDLLGEGSYAGKGIYDVDPFEAALQGRIPDGSLLSHDLFEGEFTRAGLVSDIEVVEEFPSRYDVAAARQHRWARGDWQLLPWIVGLRGPVPGVSRWKMLDNLRRSLSAPATFIALAASFGMPGTLRGPWLLFVLATLAVPTLLPVLDGLTRRPLGTPVAAHLRATGVDLLLAGQRALFQLAALPYLAWLMVDAIGRTLFRLCVSRRNLLQWVTAAQAASGERLAGVGTYRNMAGGLALAVLAFMLAALVQLAAMDRPMGLALFAPLELLWLLFPAIALRLSRAPPPPKTLALSAADALELRLIARRTWRFFETVVTAADNMLPPDNYQETPQPVLAHRTSPTNLGLYLLSVVSARDFGWIGTSEALDRLEATLHSAGRLQRFRGHFYNWYETRDLRPLEPRYVSAVDSGNLAAHLVAAAQAVRGWAAAADSAAAHDGGDAPDAVTGAGSICAGARDAVQLLRLALQPTAEADAADLHSREFESELTLLTGALWLMEPCPESDGAAFLRHLDDALLHARALADISSVRAAERSTTIATGDCREEALFWAQALQRTLQSARRDLAMEPAAHALRAARCAAFHTAASGFVDAMEFGFLLEPGRGLLSIGYRLADGSLDSSCYDLLASEARLASFLAIAKGEVPTRHWFRLGRPVTPVGTRAALLSWSGSMFEYLMPSLVMRAPDGSLLAQTNRLIVRVQMQYGTALGTPWGVSESAFNGRDVELTYQYSNFGVPALGLKRGLNENVVIAPYATALAAMVDPAAAVRNFARLATLGALGRFGFYEALDYTRSRLPEGPPFVIVRAWMAHHQGMTLVALANVLFDGIMRDRFHAEPRVQATELLLQERRPRDTPAVYARADAVAAGRIEDVALQAVRRLHSAATTTPQTHLLSNERYAVMVTAAGAGYSRWRDYDVTRWREDSTRDDSGSFVFLRDVESGAGWSAGFQPCGTTPDNYEVTFAEERADILRSDRGIVTRLQIVVSPEDDAEVRHVSVTNTTGRVRDVEVTSFAELALAPRAADAAHPAFSKLFVSTEFVSRHGALLATRRRRAPDESEIWAAHHAVVEGETQGSVQYETDRARFLGRNHELRAPFAMMEGRRLSNTVGTVLDPVFALRYRLRVPAGGTARVAFWTSVATSREAVLDLVDRQGDANAFVRASTLTWTQAQVQLRHLGVTTAEAALFQRLAGHLLFADAAMRASPDAILRGSGPPAALWSLGISGDLPIVLLRIHSLDDLALARQLLQCHEYWRLKQLAVDLVILNERATSYVQDLQAALETLHRTLASRAPADKDSRRGAVFLLRTDLIATTTRAALLSVSRVVLVAQRGSLLDQLDRVRSAQVMAESHSGPRGDAAANASAGATVSAAAPLEFFNGLGGFDADGSEYVVRLGPQQSTPAPWINVIANPQFGFQVSAEGCGYTWSLNSRENQLTPWSNDPVADRPGEALYLRDADTGRYWSPTATPVRQADARYTARHGAGYSRFGHESHGIRSDLLVYVPLGAPIKIMRLQLRNDGDRARRLSVTAYVEWVLGAARAATAPYLVSQVDSSTGALFARNPWNATYGKRTAFLDMAGRQSDWTADRREFLGRHGTLAAPLALRTTGPWSRRTGAGLDPCGALRCEVQIEAGAGVEIVVLLGDAEDAEAAQALVRRYRSADLDGVLREVVAHWDVVLGAVQVRTPDRALDLMLNRWALYQCLACRVWARSAFYQAGGAYGFRDQLQDGMALALSQPAITRAHLLRAAARQFVEGDVQHWWLPADGQGVRTRISDDRVWLGFAVAHYVATTEDTGVLDETVSWLEGPVLLPEEHESFFQPTASGDSAPLFEHCAHALDQSLALGAHGLPLIGTGDWNDGMNRVGAAGRGESVWLGWFLHATLHAFAPLAEARGESARGARWRAHASALRAALEADGWDGGWYRRGYFDDGTPLGSAASEECRIDSIAQSWSVLSGAADPERAGLAMAAVSEHLIQRPGGPAMLFSPPFDRTALDPGYVKGYPPGIRENGGQYTHAAIWVVMAFAQLGQAELALEVLSMLNPVNRSRTRADAHRYKVEPYVVAADVYAAAPHVGRGGWTWYTGSAGWFYRAGLESILGFRVAGRAMTLAPCIPAHWRGFEITFRYHGTRYEIRVEQPDAVDALAGISPSAAPHVARPVRSLSLDGLVQPPGPLALTDDGGLHRVVVVLGAAQAAG